MDSNESSDAKTRLNAFLKELDYSEKRRFLGSLEKCFKDTSNGGKEI